MEEVSLKTLLLSGECDVLWGTRGGTAVHRTFEIHSNNILYSFIEPKDSMAKHVKEKVYLEGCHVVDGGAYNDSSERLLLFLFNYDYAEKVDILGNRRSYLFTNEGGNRSFTQAEPDALPSANYVVQLFLTDKMLKWRLLQAIQRASQEYPQLFPSSPTGGGALASSGSGRVGADTATLASATGGVAAANRGSFAMYDVPNRFESKVLGRAPPRHSRQSSGVSVLSDHEVLQLSDVLREYDALQKQKAAAASSVSPLSPHGAPAAEDTRRAAAAEEEEEILPEPAASASSSACVPDVIVAASNDGGATSASASAAPARLQHSPLYDCCISCERANQACADCGAAFPSWCLLQPFGAFVCIECIGVHRKLWSNKCRGAELDLWPEADIAFMQTRGNAVVNDELEYYVAFPADSVEAAMHVDPPVKPVSSFSSIEVRESYIQWKYEEQLFTRQRHPEQAEPLPPRPDPVGVDQARLSAAPAVSDRDGEGYSSDGYHSSPTQQQQQQLQLHLQHLQQEQQRALLRDDGPPRYAGLLDVIVKELVGPESITGAVCVLTNGFQTLRTHPSRQLLHMHRSTAWDEHLQLGIEGTGRKPMYCTIYRGKGELLATGEVWLKEEIFQPGTSSMFAATLTWSQLHKKASQRNAAERWKITFLTSYQVLL